ncbi:hypothetical protein ACFV9W_31415 [Streptomyces sp. NPDC059897]|uniref:hypothetical protein n=1 Tax=Streptomyces sp. NPDC059897 TaxID=3346994 RepID=UPI003669D374
MAISGNLYISTDYGSTPQTDKGQRPYSGTVAQWNNASMWLAGGPSQTQTSVGVPTDVKVRVSNKSSTSVVPGVTVDVYVMNPFIGNGRLTPGAAIKHLVSKELEVPAAPFTAVFNCEEVTGGRWTPTQGDFDNLVKNNGHPCLIANVWANDDGRELNAGDDFQVLQDQHQGQRNIALLAMSIRGEDSQETQEFLIMPARGDTEVTVEPAEPRTALDAGERWLLLSHRDISLDHDKRRLVLHRRGKQYPLFLSDTALQAQLSVEGFADFDGRLPAFPEALPAGIRIDMSRERNVGALHVFDIVQRDRQGLALGALRMVTVVTR